MNLRSIALVSFWLLWLAAAQVRADTAVILGDSLSDAYRMPREAGWVHRLDQALAPAHDVVDAAISGDTSAGALRRIDAVLEQYQPQVLIVILGGNDGLRGLPPASLEANLAEIIERAQAAGARVGLMQIRMTPNLGPVYVDRFEAVYPRLAERYRVELIPFFLAGLFDDPAMMLDDGIHPSQAAQPRLAEFMLPYLREMLGPGD